MSEIVAGRLSCALCTSVADLPLCMLHLGQMHRPVYFLASLVVTVPCDCVSEVMACLLCLTDLELLRQLSCDRGPVAALFPGLPAACHLCLIDVHDWLVLLPPAMLNWVFVAS